MSTSRQNTDELHQKLIQGEALKRYLRRNAKNPDEAADIYQESIVRVLEQAKAQATVINNPIAYVIRVARNLLIKNNDSQVDEFTEQECRAYSPEDTLSASQQVELINQALNAMPSLRRRVFQMRRIDGESRERIAVRLDLSVEAVSKHLSRAMADIQWLIDQHRE